MSDISQFNPKKMQTQVAETQQRAVSLAHELKHAETKTQESFKRERKVTQDENKGIESRITKLEKRVSNLEKQCKKK